MEVQGSVVDTSGESLAGAHLIYNVDSFPKGATTDIDGRFSISFDDNEQNIPVEVSYLGYTSVVMPAKDLGKKPIVLKESSEVLDEIVIKATKPKPASINSNTTPIKKKTNNMETWMLILFGVGFVFTTFTLIKTARN